MIRFNELILRNFFSIGNVPVTFDLDTGKLTLIRGVNGTGKSTIIDGLFYALFGTPHRPQVKLADMINDINKKNLEATLELELHDGTPITIVRGMKPDILRITGLENLAKKKLDQAYINDLLGFDKNLFLPLRQLKTEAVI